LIVLRQINAPTEEAMACDPGNEIQRSSDHVIQIPFLEDSGIACVEVQPGDTIVLPFHVTSADISKEMPARARELDGAIIIEQDGAAIFLEGFVQHWPDVVVTGVHGTPIDIPLWLAVTDPNLHIVH
jgi:hypothetical protein